MTTHNVIVKFKYSITTCSAEEMVQIDENIAPVHDFGQKLRQKALITHLKTLVEWGRDLKNKKGVITAPSLPVISINLDLTTGCDHACGHCVDDLVINSGKKLAFEEVKQSIDTLHKQGLRSVILIGGGEPTLYPQFGEVVAYLKERKIQVGIVSNGGHGEKIIAIADLLQKGDWVRFSIDAATNDTYQQIHWKQSLRKPTHTLEKVWAYASEITKKNPTIEMGYSYVIVWDGLEYHGRKLLDNIDEIPSAAKKAREHGFTYLSLKPCLIKYEEEGETLFYHTKKEYMDQVIERIKKSIVQAKENAGRVKIMESQNLVALLSNQLERLRHQPKICYAGFLKQVINPSGIFHCPAFRGDDRAKVGPSGGYVTTDACANTGDAVLKNLLKFNATTTCSNIACFYNGVNRYIHNLIESDTDLDNLKITDGEDFFF